MRLRNTLYLALVLLLGPACPSQPSKLTDVAAPVTTRDAEVDAAPPVLIGTGFPEPGPWVSFYGTAAEMGDLEKVASTFRIINIDADPGDDGAGNFTDAQLATLKAGGRNRVLSYLDLGSCERFRSYWPKCAKCTQLGPYQGYPNEVWMDVGDPAYQALILDTVSARIAARGVDGFYLDNLEIVEHGLRDSNGPCSASCRQGGLELVRKLRERYPTLLLVMQNATSDVTRTARVGGVLFPTLLDGIAHEEVYAPEPDLGAEKELLAWQAMGLRTRDGRPLWIATEDYVGSCRPEKAEKKAQAALARSRARGFSPYVSDASAGQKVVCYW